MSERSAAPLFPLLLLLAALPARGAAQEPPEPPEPPERLEAWPELSRDETKAVETDLARVRKAHTPEMAELGAAALLGVGAGAAPAVLAALGKEKDEEALERLEEVLVGLTGAPHTRLLAAEFEHRSGAVRAFCLRRAAAFPDPGIREPAGAAYERMEGYREKKHRKYDAGEHYLTALALTSSGSLAGLDVLVERAEDEWGLLGGELLTALGAVRGRED